ncbi:uracil-xanthine permease family protein [Moorella sulfitireducens]|uniref:uracil-xanthine permease family protein n=1 Tax=Neomoorella sulfitireducens TaxID=2972948 RepID=UPI0021ACF7F4|nr:purine/pyrimidine permease [Moorella sulfitireducens]
MKEQGIVTLDALQWIVYHIGVIISAPVVVGSALGMDAAEIGKLSQLTFFLTGVASLLQIWLGHGGLLIEGPAAPWWAAIVILAGIAREMGRPLTVVRTDMEGALVVAGLALAVLGTIGLIKWARTFFTCRVTGILLMLLGLQIGGVGIKGLAAGGLKLFVIGILVLLMVIYLNMNGRGLIKNSAFILSVVCGWLLSFLAGEVNWPGIDAWFSLPSLLSWGPPTFETGSIVSFLLLGLLLVPNVVGSIAALEAATGERLPIKKYDRGLAASGISNILAGIFGGIGTIPFAISAGLVSFTGNKSPKPFVLACAIFIAMGLFPPLGALAGSVPQPVAAAVLLVSGCSLAMIGLRDVMREEIALRENFIVGLGFLSGIGVMLLPHSQWEQVPGWAAAILSNGVIVGALTSILMEHVILRRKPASHPAGGAGK